MLVVLHNAAVYDWIVEQYKFIYSAYGVKLGYCVNCIASNAFDASSEFDDELFLILITAGQLVLI